MVEPANLRTDLHPAEIEEIDESQLTFEDAEDYFELYDNENLVLVLPYDGDMDDRVLEEIKPRYVVMYEPNPPFIRRAEVFSPPPGLTPFNSESRSIERVIRRASLKYSFYIMRIRWRSSGTCRLCERKKMHLRG